MRQALPVNGDEVCINFFLFDHVDKRKYRNVSDIGSVVRDLIVTLFKL